MNKLRQEFTDPARQAYLEVLESYLTAQPTAQADTYQNLVQRLGISTTDVRNYLHRAR
jgi:hypothetical protein